MFAEPHKHHVSEGDPEMKTALVFCCIVVLISIIFSPVPAGADEPSGMIPVTGDGREILRITSEGGSGPRLIAYFDPGLTQRTICVTSGDTIVVFLAAENCPAPIDRLIYGLTCSSPPLVFVDETFEAGTATGDFYSGIDLGFGVPAEASGQLLIQTLRFAVTGSCLDGCGLDRPDGIVTTFHPVLGSGGEPSAILTTGEEIVVYGHSSMVCDDDGLPDLEIASFTSPDTAMTYEDIFPGLDLVIRNGGEDDTNEGFEIQLFLVDDMTTTYGEILSKRSISTVIPAGGTASFELEDATIPLTSEFGQKYLLLVLDGYDGVIEGDEGNNSLYHPIVIVPNLDIDSVCVYAEDFQEGAGGWTPVDLTAGEPHWKTDMHFDGATDRDVMWCGTDDASYSTQPGYGNNWNEGLVKQFSLPTGDVTLSCLLQHDVEQGYDFVRVQISTDGENYSDLAALSGRSGGFVQKDYDLTPYSGTDVSIRFLVASDNAWSDEDGGYPSKGALMIDRVAITGLPPDEFISGFDGWTADLCPPVGGEYRLEYDPPCDIAFPCGINQSGEPQVTCNAWVAYDPATGVFPFSSDEERAAGLGVNIGIVSPEIPVPFDAVAVIMEFDVYLVLPLVNNQYFTWDVAFPPDWEWQSKNHKNHLYYGTGGWTTVSFDITRYIPPGAEQMKIRLRSLESFELPFNGTHTPAPYFDNVIVYGVGTSAGGINVASFPRDCSLADSDWDGVGDVVDACPFENSAPFDRDGDGCIDETISSRHVEYVADDTLRFWIHEDGAPAVHDGSDIEAIRLGVEAWNAVSGIDIGARYMGTTEQRDARILDGMNTITFSDPDYVFPIGVLAVGISTSFVEPQRYREQPVRPGQIVDADIIFNPMMSFTTPSNTHIEGTDIKSVATHEAGHLFGLSHSAVQTSTMFFVLPPGTEASTLEVEDQLALRKAYAEQTVLDGASRLKGTVTDGQSGLPVPGAIIFAIDSASSDTLGSEYTMIDGSFDFFDLPDGDYYVAIHPLNGSSVIGYLQPANINQYVRENVVDIFVPEYWDAAESNDDDETAMTAVYVAAGATANISIITNIDLEAPFVTATSPEEGVDGVRIDAAILISFSEPIDLGTLQGNFSLEDTLSGQAIGGNVATLNDDSTLAFIPSGSLEFGAVYKLTLDIGLSDMFGNGLAVPFIFEFETEAKPDVRIVSLSPRRGIEGAVIVISGYGFAGGAAGNSVDFNGTNATILEATPTKLVVEVPAGALSGNVTVTDLVEGGTSNALTFTMLVAEEVARGYDAGSVGLGSRPRALSVSPDGSLMFIATEAGYSVVVVDPGSPDYLTARHFGVAGGMNSIEVTPDGSRVYAVSGDNEKIYRINGEAGAGGLDDLLVLSEIDAGARPLGIIVDPSGQRAFVATSGNTVQIYDINPSSATFDMQVGEISSVGTSLKGAMAIDPAGGLLVVISGEGKAAVYDLGADELLAAVDVGIDPRDVTVDPMGDRAYVTDDNGSVSIVSLEMLENVMEISTGGALRGEAVTPAGSFLYAVNRELNFYDVIDLRPESATFRSIVSNIGLPINPTDVEMSSDGMYAYSISEQDMVLSVTAIGVGPVLRSLSPVAGPDGTTVVLAGSGFSADSSVAVSFNGIEVLPEVRRDSFLVAVVPAGDVTGPVTVVGSNPSGPDAISNAAYFERLGATTADGLRLAGSLEAAGLAGEAAIASNSGDIGIFFVEEGSDQALCALDTDPSSGTFHQLLGTCPLPPGMIADEVLVTPDDDFALVIDHGAGLAGEIGFIPVIDVNRFSGTFLTMIGSIDVSSMSRGVSGACIDPAGACLVIAESGDAGGEIDATIHIFHLDSPGEAAFTPSASVDIGAVSVEHLLFQPAGLYCYLPVTDAAGPSIHVLDTDTESVTHATVVATMPLPGSPAGPVPEALAFTPSGERCLVLTRDAGATERRDVVMLDTTDPAAPTISHVEPLGGSAEGAGLIAASPRGDRAMASVEGEGLYHLAIVSGEDTVAVVGREGDGGPSLPGGFYTTDGSKYYCTAPSVDNICVYDFTEAQLLGLISGNYQSAVAGGQLPAPMRVSVSTAGSQPVEGVPVTFTVTYGTGHLTGTGAATMTVATGEDGMAGATLVLGPEIGLQQVSVASPGLTGSPIVFRADALIDPETLPLRFVDVVPIDSTTDVSMTSAVRLTFSRPVDPATVDSTVCYLLEDGAPAPEAVIIGFSDGNRRISLMPRESLEPLTGYTVGFAAGILDMSGGGLENPGTTSFRTSAPPPIVLEAVSPPSGLRGMNVVLSGQGFDRDVQDNDVFFNEFPAAVTEAALDHLIVVVPYDLIIGSSVVRVEALGQSSNMLTFNALAPDTTAIDEEVFQHVGTGSPTRSVAVTPDGALMYAVSPSANTVVAIDILSLYPLATIPVGENPYSISLDPQGDYAYVTNFLGNTVSVINIKRYSPAFNTVEKTINVGLNPIDAIVIPDGSRLVVSNLGSMSLSIVDTDKISETYHLVLTTVYANETTRSIAVTPDGGLLYIGTNDGYLVVSTVDFGVVKKVGTGSTTKTLTVTPDGALLVLLTTDGEVVIIDIAPGSPTEDQVVGRVGTGSTVKSLTVTPDGGLLYLVLEEIDAILVVRLDRITSAEALAGVDETGLEMVQTTVIDTITAGEDPAEVAFAPGGAEVAVITNAGDNTVSIYNRDLGVVAVALSGFNVRQSGERAELEWRTNVEEGTIGFHLQRSENMSFGYERITVEPLPAMGIPSTYTWNDETVRPGVTYYYKLEAVNVTGGSEEFGPLEFRLTARFTMYQNVPNPFNPVTKIRFTIPETGHVDLRIYDVTGRLVRTLVDRKLAADNHEVTWDGTNNGGRHVASGVYFYRIMAGKHRKTRKMVLLR